MVSGRFLVHEGSVRQLVIDATSGTRVSFISVYIHLFNDLLIISTKKYVTPPGGDVAATRDSGSQVPPPFHLARDQRFTVVEHASFPSQVHVEALKTEALGLPPESFLLHLSRCHNGHPTASILVAYTRYWFVRLQMLIISIIGILIFILPRILKLQV